MGTAAAVDKSLYILPNDSPVCPLDCSDAFKAKALKCGFTNEEWEGFLVYVAGFYYNNGNYRGFGDSKIIPNVTVEKVDALLRSSEAGKSSPLFFSTWEAVKPLACSLESNQLHLGFGNQGVTCYHSENITKEDAVKIDRYFKAKNIESWNTRLFKDSEKKNGKTVYRVKLASSKTVSYFLE
ncbi:hypothetical protein ANCDUO_23871 [Ancylostoma duodenale]|uniref:Uncharacterized protein n=1 Tax=Ancylostoma duodenale TaxID=51022 RepID=A0A0C2BQK6_9BILA|nr:hypothetical protein ANCDUO_23871 [Ancylostoma duodenale]